MKTLAGALALGCCLLSAKLAFADAAGHGAFADVKGGKIYYETCGSGPRSMVLIHDGVLHSAGFDAVWPALCQRYHVLRYDRRGYGRSPAARTPYSPVEDLAAVMQAAEMDHATLVGGSAGGGLAVDFALSRPDAVDRLVLAGAEVSGLTLSQHFMDRGAALVAALKRGGIAEAVKDRYVVAPGDEAARQRVLALLTANPQDLMHADPQEPAPAARPRLGSITAPTLILVGEDDIADMQGQAGALEALIPGSKRVVMRDAGHLIYLEQPQAFVDEVSGFVR